MLGFDNLYIVSRASILVSKSAIYVPTHLWSYFDESMHFAMVSRMAISGNNNCDFRCVLQICSFYWQYIIALRNNARKRFCLAIFNINTLFYFWSSVISIISNKTNPFKRKCNIKIIQIFGKSMTPKLVMFQCPPTSFLIKLSANKCTKRLSLLAG